MLCFWPRYQFPLCQAINLSSNTHTHIHTNCTFFDAVAVAVGVVGNGGNDAVPRDENDSESSSGCFCIECISPKCK